MWVRVCLCRRCLHINLHCWHGKISPIGKNGDRLPWWMVWMVSPWIAISFIVSFFDFFCMAGVKTVCSVCLRMIIEWARLFSGWNLLRLEAWMSDSVAKAQDKLLLLLSSLPFQAENVLLKQTLDSILLPHSSRIPCSILSLCNWPCGVPVHVLLFIDWLY